ncbi:MAG TPA: AraC family transcriptional regulator [Candidatus Sulfopaludibacter sp.]|jgi:AraC-like DNA-binding protein|nr:AraC family transcriptional regulator [Candidatus Sulfopaludibacter sp.]
MQRAKTQIAVVRPDGLKGLELHTGAAVSGEVPKHWHEEYQVWTLTEGRNDWLYRGSSCHSGPGCLNLVEPGELHANLAGGPRGCDYLKMDFDASWFAQLGEGIPLRATPAFVSPTMEDREAVLRFVRTHRVLRDSTCMLHRQSLLLDFLAFLVHRHTRLRTGPAPAANEPRAVRMVREYLTGNYASKIDLADLTALTGLSPFHLTRIFTRETGMAPHAFLSQIRVHRAKALLRSRLPISHVALETGFADQSHLTRVFKTFVRISPGAYRRQQ